VGVGPRTDIPGKVLKHFPKFRVPARDDLELSVFHNKGAIVGEEVHEAFRIFSKQAVAIARGKIADRFAVGKSRTNCSGVFIISPQFAGTLHD